MHCPGSGKLRTARQQFSPEKKERLRKKCWEKYSKMVWKQKTKKWKVMQNMVDPVNLSKQTEIRLGYDKASTKEYTYN